MSIPCEECIVYAICRAKYSGTSKAIIECELLWNYVVEETAQPKYVTNWLASASFQVRTKRISQVKIMFPTYDQLGWKGDIL